MNSQLSIMQAIKSGQLPQIVRGYIYNVYTVIKMIISLRKQFFSCPSLWLFSKSADIFGLHNWYISRLEDQFSVTHLTL